MTSSDDFIHLWEIEDQGPVTVDKEEGDNNGVRADDISLLEVMSIRFTCMDDFGYGVTPTRVTSSGLEVPVHEEDQDAKRHKTNEAHPNGFGGERNPNNIIYVFDASYCPANGLLGVALSDGSLRLVNGRGVCVCPITLPGNKSHLTSFGWDALGQRMASCVATGQLILWSVDCRGILDGHVAPTCRAILEGGHVAGRPLYGAAYCGGESQDLVLSWGVDGRVCLWDSHSHGQIHQPLSTLVAKSSEYPIFAVDIREVKDGEGEGESKRTARIAAGGGSEGGFIGVPMYLFDVTRGHESSMRRKEPSDEPEESDSESDGEAEPAPEEPSATESETKATLEAERESKAEPETKVEAEPAAKPEPGPQETESAEPEANPSEAKKEGDN
jgi:WD40 repeat protein